MKYKNIKKKGQQQGRLTGIFSTRDSRQEWRGSTRRRIRGTQMNTPKTPNISLTTRIFRRLWRKEDFQTIRPLRPRPRRGPRPPPHHETAEQAVPPMVCRSLMQALILEPCSESQLVKRETLFINRLNTCRVATPNPKSTQMIKIE